MRDVDAMGQGSPNELGIDQRYDAAYFGDTKPRGEVLWPIWHQEADGIAGSNTIDHRPASVAIDSLGKHLVGKRLGL